MASICFLRSAIFCSAVAIARRLELDHHLNGLTVVHRAIAIGDAVDIRGAVEHESRLDPAFQYVGHEFVHVSTNRRRAAGDSDVGVERRLRIRDRRLLRNPDATDGTAGAFGLKDLWTSWITVGTVQLGRPGLLTSFALPAFDGRAPPGA